MSSETATSSGKQVSSAIPPVPMTDEQLVPLLDQDNIEAVHVPDARPETVQTLAGTHQGDILEFYVETATTFVKFQYDMAPGGLAWKRCEPWEKNDPHITVLESDLEDYHRLQPDTEDGHEVVR